MSCQRVNAEMCAILMIGAVDGAAPVFDVGQMQIERQKRWRFDQKRAYNNNARLNQGRVFLPINNERRSILGSDFCANGANLTNKKF